MTKEEKIIKRFERRKTRIVIYITSIMFFWLATGLVFLQYKKINEKLTPEALTNLISSDHNPDKLGKLFSVLANVSDVKAKMLIGAYIFLGASGLQLGALILELMGMGHMNITVSLLKRVRKLEENQIE